MDLRITAINGATSPKELNTEWFILENIGDGPFSTVNCTLSVTRGTGKSRGAIGTLDPGFTFGPGEKVRVVCGNPGKKAHGKAPEETGIPNYYLFLAAPVIRGPGTVLVFNLRSHELCRAAFDPKQKSGVAATE